MSDALYFIPILARALRQTDPRQALSVAMAEIQEKGREPACVPGYRQFQQFMATVAEAHAADAPPPAFLVEGIVERIISDLAIGRFEGDAEARRMALALIQSRPEWRAEYESMRRELSGASASPASYAVILTGDGRLLGSLEFSGKGGAGSFQEITPGLYALALDTGRLLWQGELQESQLIWEQAFPQEPFELAADTEDLAQRRTLEESLLAGEVQLRVYPGIESGRIEIAVKAFSVHQE